MYYFLFGSDREIHNCIDSLSSISLGTKTSVHALLFTYAVHVHPDSRHLWRWDWRQGLSLRPTSFGLHMLSTITCFKDWKELVTVGCFDRYEVLDSNSVRRWFFRAQALMNLLVILKTTTPSSLPSTNSELHPCKNQAVCFISMSTKLSCRPFLYTPLPSSSRSQDHLFEFNSPYLTVWPSINFPACPSVFANRMSGSRCVSLGIVSMTRHPYYSCFLSYEGPQIIPFSNIFLGMEAYFVGCFDG